MAKRPTKAQAKVRLEMHKFKHGQLHSGSKKGPLVRNRSQAIAIALSPAKRASKSRRRR